MCSKWVLSKSLQPYLNFISKYFFCLWLRRPMTQFNLKSFIDKFIGYEKIMLLLRCSLGATLLSDILF